MGPVEIIFLTIIVIFAAIGVVRGYRRELGVTLLLFIALLVLLLLDQQAAPYRDIVLRAIAGADPAAQLAAKAILYTIFLLAIGFISYQGETLSFPGGGGESTALALGAGLLNGYLLAGSIWHYQNQAGWPLFGGLINTSAFTNFYQAAVRLLPPAVFPWWIVLIFIIFLLIMRVWK